MELHLDKSKDTWIVNGEDTIRIRKWWAPLQLTLLGNVRKETYALLVRGSAMHEYACASTGVQRVGASLFRAWRFSPAHSCWKFDCFPLPGAPHAGSW